MCLCNYFFFFFIWSSFALNEELIQLCNIEIAYQKGAAVTILSGKNRRVNWTFLL